MATFIVYDVFGYSGGNIMHLATFSYTHLNDAKDYASYVSGGYYLRNRIESHTAPAPRTDYNEPDIHPEPERLPVVTQEPETSEAIAERQWELRKWV